LANTKKLGEKHAEANQILSNYLSPEKAVVNEATPGPSGIKKVAYVSSGGKKETRLICFENNPQLQPEFF
jgi:hypothetical protein